MSQGGSTAPGSADGASAALAFAVAGVIPEGSAGPRLRHRRAGEGYDDARVVAGRVVSVGDGVELAFDLPTTEIDFILLEPAALPGSYRIPRLAYAGAVVDDLHRRVMDGAAADGRDDRGNVRFADGRGRPALELDVRDLAVSAGQPRLEMWLTRDTDGAASADAFATLLERMATDREADQVGLAGLRRELGSASDRLRDITGVVSGTPAIASGQAQLMERVDGLAASGVALEARVAALESTLAKAATEESLARLVPLLEGVASEASAGREATARDLAHVQHALGDLREQVARVTHSVENVFWRRWLRRLRGGGR